jgi:hypothetical protein
MYVLTCFPASRKRCEKFAFLARETRIFQIDPDVEMNVSLLHGKGVVIADVRFYRLSAIVWQSGYFQL